MIKCHLDEEPRAYITSMRILSAVTLPVDLFGVYCIVAKSPPIMKEYSRLLLIYQILATLTDTWTNMMFIPVAFLPFPITYHVGLVLPRVHMKYCYMQIAWLCLISTTMGAVVQLFVFRWQSLLMNDHPLRLRKKVIKAIVTTNFILFNIKPLYAEVGRPFARYIRRCLPFLLLDFHHSIIQFNLLIQHQINLHNIFKPSLNPIFEVLVRFKILLFLPDQLLYCFPCESCNLWFCIVMPLFSDSRCHFVELATVCGSSKCLSNSESFPVNHSSYIHQRLKRIFLS
ncbi:unnamed protein product [Heligmosomoides polygyrus]|uniref:G protein-coupled receptor n=1 Tax=Heligmosomoides polygyrus TaxID=6339 RepID=A0A183F8F7_HELPZ|nr:unnamed protein product [Heligmosomoides polygyrus]